MSEVKLYNTVALAADLPGLSGTTLSQSGCFEQELSQVRQDKTFMKRRGKQDNNAGVVSVSSCIHVPVELGQSE